MELVSEKYKQTELGLIPSDWEVGNLLENFTLKARIGWQGLTTAEYLKTGDFGLVTGTDFKNGYIDWDNCVYVERNRFVQDKNIQLKIFDVLVTKDGTIGKVAFIDKLPNPTTLNSGVFVVRPKNENIDNRFFYYLLMSFYFDNFLTKITAGSTITHLYQKDFITFNFILPTKAEQTAIATALSDADALISSLEKLITKKRNIKQGVMQKLLQPKEGWVVKRLGEVAEIKKGQQLNRDGLNDNDLYPVINGGVLPSGYTDSWNQKANTVIISEGGNSCGYVNLIKTNFWQGGHCYSLETKIHNEFLYHLLKSNEKQIMALRVGSGLPNIQRNRLITFEINLPTSEEQIVIATILSDIDAEIAALETKLEKYKKVKLGMMQNLLTGKIRLV